LRNNEIEHVEIGRRAPLGKKSIQRIFEALACNTSLVSLGFTLAQHIGDNGEKQLAKALRHNTTLKELRLSNFLHGEDAGTQLADALISNTSLTSLDISYNRCNLAHFCRALEINKTLMELKLSYKENRKPRKKLKLIQEYLKRNIATANKVGTLNVASLQEGISRVRQTLGGCGDSVWLTVCKYLSPLALDAIAGSSSDCWANVKRSYDLVHRKLTPFQFGQWLCSDFRRGDQVSVLPESDHRVGRRERWTAGIIDDIKLDEKVRVEIHLPPTANGPDKMTLSTLRELTKHVRNPRDPFPNIRRFNEGDRVCVWSRSLQRWCLDGKVINVETYKGERDLFVSYGDHHAGRGDGLTKTIVEVSPHVARYCIMTMLDLPRLSCGEEFLRDVLDQIDGLPAKAKLKKSKT
jgi:hypothetical protein